MKVIGSIAMYCGMQDPEIELTPEEYHKINELLCQATEAATDTRITYKMPSGYRVTWHSEGPTVSVYVAFNTISISCFGTRTLLKDTVGLGSYLKDLLAPTLLKHFDDGEAAYNEEMLRTAEQKKI